MNQQQSTTLTSILLIIIFVFSCNSPQKESEKLLTTDTNALDSVIYNTDYCDYACYFPKEKYSKEELINVIDFFCINGTFRDTKFWFFDLPEKSYSVPELSNYYNNIIDSVSMLKFPNFEPWISFKKDIIQYNRLIFDSNLILIKGVANPKFLYNLKVVQDDIDLPMLVNRWAMSDSAHTKLNYFILIANKLTRKIDQKVSILSSGNLMHFEEEFFKLFDTIRTFNEVEP